MTNTPATPQTLPPHAQLVQMVTAAVVSKVIYTAARLGLADRLADGPATAAELAGVTGTHAPSLHRLMRTLAGLGLLTHADGDRFALTPLGAALRSDAPGAAYASVLTLGGPAFSQAFDRLEHSLQTGQTGFEAAFGMPIFDYLGQHPEEARLFGETMIGFHGAEPPAVAEAYDFSSFGTICDVGGGTGNLLGTILARHPTPRGILFDLPHVAQEAPTVLAERGSRTGSRWSRATSSRPSPPAPTATSCRTSSMTGPRSSA
ncbi:MAG TPA: methyltransferase [bacterium]|nr:methyltransferase [bacterium]